MSFQRFSKYLLSHRIAALGLTLVVSSMYILPGGGLMSRLGIIFASLVTLVKGPKEGALYTLAATVPVLIYVYSIGALNVLLPTTFVGVLVISNLLTWAFAGMLYRKATWSQIVQLAALMGVFAVSVIHLAYPGIVDWWTTQILQSLVAFKKILVQFKWEKAFILPDDMQSVAAQSAQTATGFTTITILLASFIQLIFARWWQAKLFQPGSLGFELRNIRLSNLAGLGFTATLVMLYYGNSVLMDIMPILILLFGIAGLSLLHYFFALLPRTPSTLFWFVLTYIVMIFTADISLLLLSIFALFDIGLDLRRRFIKV